MEETHRASYQESAGAPMPSQIAHQISMYSLSGSSLNPGLRFYGGSSM